MTHEFEEREYTGWSVCKICGFIKPADGEVSTECTPMEFDEED
jgi:hypothetical protein